MKSLHFYINVLTLIILLFIYSSINAQTARSQNNPGNSGVEIPSSETGMIVKEFVASINSSDPSRIKLFAHQYLREDLGNVGSESWDEEKYVRLLFNLQKQCGKLIAADIQQNNSPEYLGITFQATAVPSQILNIEFVKNKYSNSLRYIELHSMKMPKGPYQWTKDKLDDKGIAEAIDQRIMSELADDQFSGTVLIARGQDILLHKAYGYSDRENGKMNTIDTRFHTGSVGKMMTSVAIGQLVEKGQLKFTDTLGRIMPGYPNKNAAKNVTIHQLLTHTAGIADPFELGKMQLGKDYSTAASNLELIADEPLTMKPGAYHSYSNGNYAVLAAIVERISGISFEEYLQKNIFIPAGMKIADHSSYIKLPRAISYTYKPEDDPLGIHQRVMAKPLEIIPQFAYTGYSNNYLTAEDVYKFLLALREGKLVSPEMVSTLTTGKVDVQPGAPIKYSYGFYEANMWGTNMRGHSGGGGNSGIGADAEMVWNNNYYVIVLGNYDLEVVRPLTFSIVRFLGTK